MSDSSLEYINNLIDQANIKDSYGVIMLRNGLMINVRFGFEEALFQWKQYKAAKSLNDKEMIKEITLETGGVIDTSDITVEIEQISAMFPAYVYYENKETAKRVHEKDKKIRDYLINTLNMKKFKENDD
jgi:hypothetical protein